MPNPIQRLFGLKYPIFQAPTGSIAGPELAAAVSSAGAMGAMGLTWTDPQAAGNYVHWVRSHTEGLFAANFALAFEPVALDAVLEAGVPAVTFSYGDPKPYVGRVREAGALLGIQVTSSKGALRALEQSPDFLLCQGVEAGGHLQSFTPLTELLVAILSVAGGVPVAAAGGIGNGAEIAAVLRAGASAAILGTRFVATRQSLAHPEYKRLLSQQTANDAVLTLCFDGGWPQAAHRVLRNQTLDDWEAAGSPPTGSRPGEGDIVAGTADGAPIYRYEDTAPRAGMTGSIGDMCLYAGKSCASISDIPDAAQLVYRLWEECERALAESASATFQSN